MKKSYYSLLGLIFIIGQISFAVAAENSENFIKNLRGCFSVSFRYVENGKYDQQIDELYEWVAPAPGDPETSLQHVGVVQGTAFKHWREEWREISDGVWNQKVIGPFGDFRYECSAPIIFLQWRCTAPNAPKPRRDKDRTDYATLDREVTIQATSKQVVQAENNVKRDKEGNAVSNEIGWNEYKRVDDSKCQAAIDFLAHGAH